MGKTYQKVMAGYGHVNIQFYFLNDKKVIIFTKSFNIMII